MKRLYKNVTVDKKLIFNVIVSVTEKEVYIEIEENINNKIYHLNYPISSYKEYNTYFKIDNNYFYDDYIDLNINSDDIKLSGFLYYSDFTNLNKDYKYNIINKVKKIFSKKDKVKVISYHHYIDGVLKYNDLEIDFEDGIGFIKDDEFNSNDCLYLHSNLLFKDISLYKKVSFSLYTNNKNKLNLGSFKALLLINDKEYQFSKYNGYKLTRIKKKNNIYQYIFKRRNNKLIVSVKPLNKVNNKYIDLVINVILIKNKKIIFKQKMISGWYEKKITNS